MPTNILCSLKRGIKITTDIPDFCSNFIGFNRKKLSSTIDSQVGDDGKTWNHSGIEKIKRENKTEEEEFQITKFLAMFPILFQCIYWKGRQSQKKHHKTKILRNDDIF